MSLFRGTLNACFLLCFLLPSFVFGQKESDFISSIPGYTGKKHPFDTYAGYLATLSGSLFYILTKSSNNPSNDPLVLWLNGGPGCSSLLGLFIELGPYHPYNYGKNIEYNPYAWNNYANILHIESPPCVGFSYPHNRYCTNYYTNDNQTKYDNYYALQTFFKKFPEFKDRDFYITGESYAGHYIPQLSQLILMKNKNSNNIHINLKSIAIGNPYIDRDSNWFDGFLPTMFNYGIINQYQFEQLQSGHCINKTLGNKLCRNDTNIFLDTYVNDINIYDINVLHNCSMRSRQSTELLRYIYQSNNFKTNLKTANIWSYPYTPCNEYDLNQYLNRLDVWKAFNVDINWIQNEHILNNYSWKVCTSNRWNGYDTNKVDDGISQVPYIKDLLQTYNLNILIYSGNADLVCAYSGSRYWIVNELNDTNITGNLETEWKSWYINNENAGWYQKWQKFTFLVVRDAGHEVPEYKPIRAYSLFKRFLENNYADYYVNVSNFDWNLYNNNIKTTTTNDKIFTLDPLWFGVIVGFGSCLLIVCMLSLCCCVIRRRKQPPKFELMVDEQL